MILPPEDPQKGDTTMLVKAKWTVKDSSGWHDAGEVWNTSEDLGDAVESLEKATKPKTKPAEPVAEEPEEKPAEAEKAETAKPRSNRRKNK